jgi:hypothetical protein
MCASFGTIGDGERVYTVAEVADILVCSERQVRDHITEGENGIFLEAINIGRGSHKEFRIMESDLREFMRKRKWVPTAKLLRTAKVTAKKKRKVEAQPETSGGFLAELQAHLATKG